MANTFSAGLAWALYLAFPGWKIGMPVSRITYCLWVLYLSIGIGSAVMYRQSTVQLLQSCYFIIYAAMGFMCHFREMHLGTLWLVSLDRKAAANINQSTAASPATCPECAEGGPPAPATTKAATAAGKPFAARPAKWLSSSRLAIVLMCFLIDYVIYRAWVMSVCKEEDQLVCLYRLLYAIMLVVWLEHEVELGRWEFSDAFLLQKKSTPAATPPKQPTAIDIAFATEKGFLEQVLNLDLFGYGGASTLTKVMFWAHAQYTIIVIATIFLYWNLPREHWVYTVEAGLYAWHASGFVCFTCDISTFQQRGNGYF